MATEDQDLRERLMRSALALAGSSGWRSASLAAIAANAGVSLVEAYVAFPTRLALLAGLLGRTDRRVLEDGPAEPEDSPRDRLFDVLMRRFDALAADRAGVVAIIHGLPGDPLTALQLAPGFAASMAWMLEAAGLSTTGIFGLLRVKGLAIVYLATLRTWLDDDSIDMAKTMAALDRNLRRADQLARRSPTRDHSGDGASVRQPLSPAGSDESPAPAS
jgi:AcrR family transcriptional regulator